MLVHCDRNHNYNLLTYSTFQISSLPHPIHITNTNLFPSSTHSSTTQPTNDVLVWANTDVNLPNLAGPNKTEPSADLVAKGWDFKQKPSADEFNYILNNYSEWIKYLKDYVNEIVIEGATGDAANAGSVIYFARDSAPVGYLKANGAAVNNTVYTNLS